MHQLKWYHRRCLQACCLRYIAPLCNFSISAQLSLLSKMRSLRSVTRLFYTVTHFALSTPKYLLLYHYNINFMLLRCLIILFPRITTSIMWNGKSTALPGFGFLPETEVFINKSHILDPVPLDDFPSSMGKLWRYTFMNADALVFNAAHDWHDFFFLTENKLVSITEYNQLSRWCYWYLHLIFPTLLSLFIFSKLIWCAERKWNWRLRPWNFIPCDFLFIYRK